MDHRNCNRKNIEDAEGNSSSSHSNSYRKPKDNNPCLLSPSLPSCIISYPGIHQMNLYSKSWGWDAKSAFEAPSPPMKCGIVEFVMHETNDDLPYLKPHLISK